MTYRIFTNDVGLRMDGYSCLKTIDAGSDGRALRKALLLAAPLAPVKILAIPDNKLDECFVHGSYTDEGGLKPLKGVFGKYGRRIV